MKWFLIVLILLGIFFYKIDEAWKESLTKIRLPMMTRDVVGEIPMIEHFDDGNLEGNASYRDAIADYDKILRNKEHQEYKGKYEIRPYYGGQGIVSSMIIWEGRHIWE